MMPEMSLRLFSWCQLDPQQQEEDEKLVALVQKYGVDTKKWRQIAEELGTTKNSAKCGTS